MLQLRRKAAVMRQVTVRSVTGPTTRRPAPISDTTDYGIPARDLADEVKC